MKKKDAMNFLFEASKLSINKMSIDINQHEYKELIDDTNNGLEYTSDMGVKCKAIEKSGFKFAYAGVVLTINVT